ncbi:tRNA pseudouridine(13) synthase TruD [Leptospira sp. 201903070]|uniref:tRNA pseudouridine synthase D n=1 Tax=Leptospira ainlahdjerensis TaxID=2810033 RepID=A0ABS2UK16_9LEPT|nr:tRNA pseudouridine(13) synthase TruD [Leptospira ainlahdjerensis]MBM9579620.1 tRNA pseudouridine(13) synthase TruD [Leptospira ainlahdjerensis]
MEIVSERPFSGFLVYELKQSPEDFQVEEILKPDWLKESGKWTIFRLKKSGWNTLDALQGIAKESHVSLNEIGYAGKKDRHATTIQHISAEQILQVPKELSSVLKLETIGRGTRPLTPEANAGNRFVLTLRNLIEREEDMIRRNFEKVSISGFINYYDSQRFSRFHPEFRLPIFPYLQGDPETSLKLLLTDPFPGEKKQARDRKKELQKLWGNWGACEKLSGTKLESRIFSLLKREKNLTQKVYSESISLFPEEELLMLLSSLQSLVWNEFVSELLSSESSSGVWIKTKSGSLFFSEESLTRTFPPDYNLPVPGAPGIKTLEYSNKEMNFLSYVLVRLSLEESVFEKSPFSKVKMKSFERNLKVIPEDFAMEEFETDDLHPGRKKVKITFRLPSGAYATMLVKRLMLRAEI